MQVVHARCAGLDVHKETVVACVRVASGSSVSEEVETFSTLTKSLSSSQRGWWSRRRRWSGWRQLASTGVRCGTSSKRAASR